MKRYFHLPALGVAAVVILAGCGVDSGTSAGSTSSSVAEKGTTVSAEHNSADVMFAQMMIPHHQQAVEMSDIVLGKDSIAPEVNNLAKRIKGAQAPEIETMTGWLEAWGEPVKHGGGHHGGSSGSMDGMLSEEQMAELEAAEGDEAGTMFLESMIAHHEGAVAMADEEIANGENAEAVALAEAIVEAQKAEIEEMEELLAS